MKNKYNFALLGSLLIISLIPITIFFVFDYPRAEIFIRGFVTGPFGVISLDILAYLQNAETWGRNHSFDFI